MVYKIGLNEMCRIYTNGALCLPTIFYGWIVPKKKKKKIRCISLDNEFAIIFYFHLVLVFHMSLEVLVFHMSLELFFFLF